MKEKMKKSRIISLISGGCCVLCALLAVVCIILIRYYMGKLGDGDSENGAALALYAFFAALLSTIAVPFTIFQAITDLIFGILPMVFGGKKSQLACAIFCFADFIGALAIFFLANLWYVRWMFLFAILFIINAIFRIAANVLYNKAKVTEEPPVKK